MTLRAGENGAAWCFGRGRMIHDFRPIPLSFKLQVLFSSKSTVNLRKYARVLDGSREPAARKNSKNVTLTERSS